MMSLLGADKRTAHAINRAPFLLRKVNRRSFQAESIPRDLPMALRIAELQMTATSPACSSWSLNP